MRRLPRLTLAPIMSAIAGLAVVLAISPAPVAIVLAAGLIVIIALSAFVSVPLSRLVAWGLACLPVLALVSLHATWLSAWYALGHRPRPYLDDPKYIGPLVDALRLVTWVLLQTPMPSLLIYGAITALELARCRTRGEGLRSKDLCLIGRLLLSWPVALGVVAADLGGIVTWFFD